LLCPNPPANSPPYSDGVMIESQRYTGISTVFV
jgi:hypothetical protein